MGCVTRKLHSRRGASMMIALLFFLICTMVASVVVMAASANTDRTALRRQEQQAYLAVSSAYEFLKADLSAGTLVYTGSESHVIFECHQLSSNPVETLVEVVHNGVSQGNIPPGCYTACDAGGETTSFVQNTVPDCYIGPLLAEMATEIAKTATTYNAAMPLIPSLSRSFTIDGEGLPQVTVTLTMSGVEDSLYRYDVDVLLTVADSSYSLQFKLDGSADAPALTTQAVAVATNTHAHIVSYIGDLGNGNWGAITTSYPSTEKRNILTTRIEWLPPESVSKGGV